MFNLVLMFVMYALLGSTFAFGNDVIKDVHPMFFLFLRFVLAGGALVGYQLWRSPESLKMKKSQLKILAWYACLLFLSYATEFLLYDYIQGTKVALMYNLTPFVTALFAYLYFSERMTWKKWLGLIIGFIGVLPMICGGNSTCSNTAFWMISWPEVVLFIGAIVPGAYMWIVFKECLNSGSKPVAINGYSMLIVAVLSLIASFILEPWNPVPVMSWYYTGFYLFYFILVGNIAFLNMYGYLLNHFTTTFLSFCGFIMPMFAAIIQYLFFGIPISTTFYISLTVVSVGLYIFYHEEFRQGYVQDGEK